MIPILHKEAPNVASILRLALLHSRFGFIIRIVRGLLIRTHSVHNTNLVCAVCLPPADLPTYLPTCLPAYLRTCLPAYLPTYLPAYRLSPIAYRLSPIAYRLSLIAYRLSLIAYLKFLSKSKKLKQQILNIPQMILFEKRCIHGLLKGSATGKIHIDPEQLTFADKLTGY